MTKEVQWGARLQDVAWMRDRKNVYTGDALKLACLLHVRKGRNAKQEEELKEIFNVY